MTTLAERVKKSNAKLIEDGGRIISTLRLQPGTSKTLAILERHAGNKPSRIISELIDREGARLSAALYRELDESITKGNQV
jgi:superfamily II helicase